MFEELGITEEQYQELLTKVEVSDIFNFMTKYKYGQVSIYNYADEHGRFIPPKSKFDIIAKYVFDAHSPAEKINFLSYLESVEEGKI